MRIDSYRKAARIPHPCVFATPETIAAASSPAHARAMYLFNCTQRAHHNFVENYPVVLSGMLCSGLVYPRLAAVLGSVWLVGRVLYTFGYSSANPKNVEGRGRFSGGGFHMAAFAQVGFWFLNGKIAWDLLVTKV